MQRRFDPQHGRTHLVSEVLSQSLEEWMADLAPRRLCPVLDLGQQLRLDPDSLVRDPLGVGPVLTDRRLQPPLQVGGGRLVEPWPTLPARISLSPLCRPR
jgi:hypothetical protein